MIKSEPTALGREFLKLLPVFAAAAEVRGGLMDLAWHPEYDAVKVEAAQTALDEIRERVEEIEDAIEVGLAANPVKHIADFAIVCRWNADSAGFGPEVTRTFVTSVLAAAGIPESALPLGPSDQADDGVRH